MDPLAKTLIAYRKQVQEITSKYPTSPISIEIDTASKSLDDFILSYEQMDRAQKRFERYLQGIHTSFSPEKTSALAKLPDSNSFKEWSELVSTCVGDV